MKFLRELFLILAALTASFDSMHAKGGNGVANYNKSSNGIFYQMRHGICPEGIHYTAAILAGGCAALPGIASENILKNRYADFTPGMSTGLNCLSVAVGTYAVYKTNQLLSTRTPAAIFIQKAKLQKKIKKLTINDTISKHSILQKLAARFAVKAEQGIYVLMSNYLKKLIKDIKWINSKLIILGEPTIDLFVIDALEAALVSIVTEPMYDTELKRNKEYNVQEYNNRLTTKIQNASWWLTKNGVKASVKASWFVTKVAATVCWDTFKIVLQAAIGK